LEHGSYLLPLGRYPIRLVGGVYDYSQPKIGRVMAGWREGWLADYYPEEGGTGFHYSPDGEDSHSLKAFFKHRDRPTTNGARCDACRAIAFRLDKAFDFAESHISVDGAREGHTANGLPELSGEEVTTIASYICSKNTFSDVKPFKYESITRLLTQGIETPLLYSKGSVDDMTTTRGRTVDWPQRVENHCKYLITERLQSREVYEVWLRTSAAAYQDYSTFESFLCFGEYVFGDCVGRSGPQTEDDFWPGGDDKQPVDATSATEAGDDVTADAKGIQDQALIEFERNFQEWYEETRGGVRSEASSLLLNGLSACCVSIWAFKSLLISWPH